MRSVQVVMKVVSAFRSEPLRILARSKVEPRAHAITISTLAPSIEELMKVVQVVLSMTVALPSGSLGVIRRHADPPTVVTAGRDENVAVVVVDQVLEQSGSSVDVEVDVVAVAARSASTVHGSELHETGLTIASGSAWVASRLLHGKRGEQDRRDAVLVAVLLKGPKVWRTRAEDAIGVEILVDEVVESQVRRRPSAALETTVEPFLRAVRGIISSAAPAAGGVGEGDDATDNATQTSAGRRGRLRWSLRGGRRRGSWSSRRRGGMIGPGALVGDGRRLGSGRRRGGRGARSGSARRGGTGDSRGRRSRR